MLPLRPMIGCIGTAPVERASSAVAGPHGGNLDHPSIAVGAEVLLPVFVDGGLLSIGDVHALQGHGELSGVALEVPSQVVVEVDARPDVGIEWPWLRRDGTISVLVAASTFEVAVGVAVDQYIRRLEYDSGWDTAEAMALLSLVGDIRVGSSWGGSYVTISLDVPDEFGILPKAFKGGAHG